MEQSSNISQALSRKFWVIILGLILGVALGALVSQLMTPVYQSRVNLLVAPVSGSGESATANSYAQAYSKLVTDPEITESAISESGVSVDAQDIKRIVSVDASPASPLIQIIASSQNPEEASVLANALGSGLSSLTKTGAGSSTGYQANIVTQAVPPAHPTLPNWILNMVVGAFMGLLVGGMIALFWNDAWDERRQARRAEKERQQRERQEEKDRQRLEAQEEKERQRREKELRDLERMLGRYQELRSEDLQRMRHEDLQSSHQEESERK